MAAGGAAREKAPFSSVTATVARSSMVTVTPGSGVLVSPATTRPRTSKVADGAADCAEPGVAPRRTRRRTGQDRRGVGNPTTPRGEPGNHVDDTPRRAGIRKHPARVAITPPAGARGCDAAPRLEFVAGRNQSIGRTADQARLGGARAGSAARESERGAPPCSSIQSTDVEAGARRYCGVSTQPNRSEDAVWQYGQCRSGVLTGEGPGSNAVVGRRRGPPSSTCGSAPASVAGEDQARGPAGASTSRNTSQSARSRVASGTAISPQCHSPRAIVKAQRLPADVGAAILVAPAWPLSSIPPGCCPSQRPASLVARSCSPPGRR